MACSCNRQPCICSDSCDAPELFVEGPSGSQNGQSLDQTCQNCDIATDDCCNQFSFESEGNGRSFVLSVGGQKFPSPPLPTAAVVPFKVVNPGTGQCDPQQGCCDILLPVPIPGLGSIACMPEPLPPGTYQIFARATVFSIVPDALPFPTNGGGVINAGAKISIRYIEDCNNPINPVEIAGCEKPCCCQGVPDVVSAMPALTPPPGIAVFPIADASGVTIFPYEVIQCSGFELIYSPTCRPAFQILAINGCPPLGVPSADLYVANIQIVMLKISSRDLVGCGGFPTAAIVPFSRPSGCGTPT